MDVDDAELMSLLSEQRRELTAAITADSDLDFAFQLQMQEAINISLTSHSSTSSSSATSSRRQPFLRLTEVTDSPSGIAHLLAEQIDNFNRSHHDRELVKNETNRIQTNLNRLIHDQVFARQIVNVPENEWIRTGDYIEKPFGESPVLNNEVFRVYVKGLVSDENVLDVKMTFAAIGVAICDVSDCCVFELAKAVEISDGHVVEMKAVIEAMNAAVELGLTRVHVFCDNESVYQYLTGKGGVANNNNNVALVDQLNVIQRKFAYCGPFLVRRNEMKSVYKLAGDAIASQVTKFAENAYGKTLLEQCAICFEFIYAGQMFSVNTCLHKYCFSCMRRHVEAKLLQGKLPECPHEKCGSKLDTESCKKFLNAELYDFMSLRVKEASIPVTEKVYCPFSNCSALMSKTELLDHGATSSQVTGMRKCVKCYRLLCINCKVPWHDNISCSDYMSRFPFQSANEAKLKSLATRKHWRECIKCKNFVELATGCYHIYCRCGFEFCYTCGAEWINKKATCKCPIWDEHNILYAEQNRHGNRP